MTRTISIIAAVAANGAIGFKGGIPWDSPEDRALFASKTAGGVLVCGWNTAEILQPILSKNRQDRDLVSITDGLFYIFDWDEEDCGFYAKDEYSLEAVAAHYPDRNIWICGGSRLYAEAMRNPLVTEMHLSLMDCEPDADAFFPRLCLSNDRTVAHTGRHVWGCTYENRHHKDNFTHRVYKRI